MAIPPFNDLRLNPGEENDPRRLRELFEGMTRNFEDLYEKAQTIEASNEAGNGFLRLLTKGKVRLAHGQANATWAAAQNSAAVTINHGLGAVPVRVWIGSRNWPLSYGCEERTKTTIKVQGGDMRGVLTGTFTFDWLAIG